MAVWAHMLGVWDTHGVAALNDQSCCVCGGTISGEEHQLSRPAAAEIKEQRPRLLSCTRYGSAPLSNHVLHTIGGIVSNLSCVARPSMWSAAMLLVVSVERPPSPPDYGGSLASHLGLTMLKAALCLSCNQHLWISLYPPRHPTELLPKFKEELLVKDGGLCGLTRSLGTVANCVSAWQAQCDTRVVGH